MTSTVRVRAPGKVNLYLAVGPREPDGYHNLVTVFQAVDIFEEITARSASTLSLTMSGRGAGLPTDESNLAIRAARLGFRVTEIPVARRYPASGPVPTKISPIRGNLRVIRCLFAACFGRYNPSPA